MKWQETQKHFLTFFLFNIPLDNFSKGTQSFCDGPQKGKIVTNYSGDLNTELVWYSNCWK